MAVRTTTFRVTLLIIIIVAILIIVNSLWTLWFLNKSVDAKCVCTQEVSSDAAGLRAYSIIMLLVGFGIGAYAVAMYFMPTAEKRDRFIRE